MEKDNGVIDNVLADVNEIMQNMNQNVEEEVIENIDPIEEVEEAKPLVQETKSYTNSSDNFDSIFDNLYAQANKANDFISNLMEQKKNVSLNETYLKESQEKLAKEREDFERYMNDQKESLKLSKQQLDEYEKNQKLRLQNEEE